MPGLFSTPDEVQQAQQAFQEQQARGFGALGPEGAGGYLGMRAGQAIGGLLSGPNPAMIRSTLVQDALREVGQGDTEIGTPKYFEALTKALKARSLTNDALSVTEYAEKLRGERAKSTREEAAAEKDKAQTARENAALGIFLGAGQPGQMRQPGIQPDVQETQQAADQGLPAPTAAPAAPLNPMEDPQKLRAYGLLANRPEFITHAERIEKKSEFDKNLKLAKDPQNGLFSALFNDPDPQIARTARQAQENLTTGKLDYTNAESLYKNLSERSTAIAVAKATAKEKQEQFAFEPGALKIAAWEKLLFGTDPRGYGNATQLQRKQVNDERSRIATELGLSPIEAAMLPQDNRVKMKAVDALTKWGATVARSGDKLERDFAVAIDYAKKLSPGKVQFINRAVIAGRKEFNDPDANAYASALNSVRAEYARLMSGPTSNAMLPVEAMKTGNELISKGVNVAALEEVGKQMKRDANNTVFATNDQINSIRGSIQNVGRTPAISTAVPQYQEGDTATGPRNEKIIFRSGQWRAAQ